MKHAVFSALSILSVASVVATYAEPARALAPGQEQRGFREGANHHLGDDSFANEFGRQPTVNDGEAVRMHSHLKYVRAWLASRPATFPELASKRATLLSYLDDYIAHGRTPANIHLPWRSPVFIDDDGAICAVGYLIERSAGRPLAETIAMEHRYDLLEDIATAMPEVRRWIDASGLSLDELASIQPGYIASIDMWEPSDLGAEHPPDGPFSNSTEEDGAIEGHIRNGLMEGEWKKTDPSQHVVGSGHFSRGSGTWQSFYPDGAKLAEGTYAKNIPHGSWRFFHPNGTLAARGSFDRGRRQGPWQFFQDDKASTLITAGNFYGGQTAGTWNHYDARGALLGVSWDHTPRRWKESFGGHLLHIEPGQDGVHHWVHEGNIAGDSHRLDLLFDGSELLYAKMLNYVGPRAVYDATGHRLTLIDGQWMSSDCSWNHARKSAAAAGDIVSLHGLVYADADEGDTCGPTQAISPQRARHVAKMVDSFGSVRAASPEFLRKLVLGNAGIDELAPPSEEADDYTTKMKADAADMAKVLAASMSWYVEWPHVDGRFIQVFRTLPGYRRK